MSNNSAEQAAATLLFSDLNLNSNILQALGDLGYRQPSPIQEKIIPLILEGRDVLGQAQTGTGKTAAFALPILEKINIEKRVPQALVLAPTRELALQVAEAFKSYSKFLRGLKVLAVYGGQDFKQQLRPLNEGVHIVVGTPGRTMDHIRRGKLQLENIEHIVLDEADEMLRMGFIDDIEWIMQQLPEERQTALLSATMPKPIQKIAQNYLHDPAEIKIKVKTTTAETVTQRYYYCNRNQKFDGLTRILESEDTDAVIIFVRTKANTLELSERLQQLGFNSSALNGDIAQNLREQTVKKVKSGKIDILIATDVAARGLDVERITHVINYDVPFDTESYVHRIGRTGRAGRKGDAILFIEPREKRFLNMIERATGQAIEEMHLASGAELTEQRVKRFKQQILDTAQNSDLKELDFYLDVAGDLIDEGKIELEPLVASLVKMAQGRHPLIVEDMKQAKPSRRDKQRGEKGDSRERSKRKRNQKGKASDVPMDTYVLQVGEVHKVTPKNILGAVCNEGELDSQFVGSINIEKENTFIELPAGMPEETFNALYNAKIMGKKLHIQKAKTHKRKPPRSPRKRKPKK